VNGESWQSLGLTGAEQVTLEGVAKLSPRQMVDLKVTNPDGSTRTIKALCRIDTENEVAYFANGGILHFVLRSLAKAA
jgi:aconitate hydratase